CLILWGQSLIEKGFSIKMYLPKVQFTHHTVDTSSGLLLINGKITSKKIANIDKTAKDAIANSDYTFVKYGGNRHGHMELRFTATGNWYTHHVSIK
ncbi:hypothetical protein, partial [Bacillus subtilis]